MLMKKASCLAADFLRHGRKAESEMMPLTDSSTIGSTWSEQGAEGTASSTEAVLPGAKRRSRREAVLELQRQRRSHRSPSPSPPELGLDDSQASVTSVRGASPKPRRQQWSSMFYVHMSLVVVTLAVAATIALVFTLRDSDVQNPDIGGQVDDDAGEEAPADDRNMSKPAVIQFHSHEIKEHGTPGRNKTDKDNVGGRVELDSRSPSIGRAGGLRHSMSKQKHSAAGSPVFWIEDGISGAVREDGLPLMPPPRHTSGHYDGRRRRSVPLGGNPTSTVQKVTDSPPPSLSGTYEEKIAFSKANRGLKRLNRKDVVRSKGIRGLVNS